VSFRMIGSFRPDLYRMLISGVDQYLPSLLLYYFATALLGCGPPRPRLRKRLCDRDRIFRRSATFPALAAFGGGPLGPRLRKMTSPTRTGSRSICGAS